MKFGVTVGIAGCSQDWLSDPKAAMLRGVVEPFGEEADSKSTDQLRIGPKVSDSPRWVNKRQAARL
jgi:hypothetical protein